MPASTEISAIVIDTYNPRGPDIAGTNLFIDLFAAEGDTAADPAADPYVVWSTNTTGAPAALAWSDGSNNPDPAQTGFAYISYPGPIERGVPYYIRVRLVNEADSMAYAIRLLGQETDPSTREASWYFGSENLRDPAGAPVEGGHGIPTAYQTLTLNGKINCYLNAGEVDWFRFVLP